MPQTYLGTIIFMVNIKNSVGNESLTMEEKGSVLFIVWAY